MLAMSTDNFWTGFLLLLIWIPMVMLWVFTLMDLFRRDMNGWLVALWIFLIVFLPLIGVFAYWITRPFTLTEKDVETQKEAMEDYEQLKAAQETDQLFKLQQLKEKGVLSDEQFEKKKAKLLKD
jgi:flagellar biosynthesis/type III secretory pathway M-ring protein FliF/YscJ